MPVRLKLTHHEADELVRLIDEEEVVDEEAMQRVKAQILDDPHPTRVRREDLELLLDMVPLDFYEIHVMTSTCAADKLSKKHLKECLGCKLTARREKAVRRLRQALGMPMPRGKQ